MKTLVVSNSSWLAEYLGASLYGAAFSPDGVTAVNEYQDVWDLVIHDGGSVAATEGDIGKSLISEKMEEDAQYKETLLLGTGIPVTDSKGTDFGVLLWYDEGWVGKAALVVEQHGLMNRDLGVRNGVASGVTLQAVDGDLIDQVQLGMESLCQGYRGPVCVDVTAVEKTLYLRDVKLGFKKGWVETALEIQTGRLLGDPMNLTGNVAVGVLVSVPPYPYSLEIKPDLDGVTVDPGAMKHLRYQDVMNGALFYSTAWGVAYNGELIAKEARLRIYRSLRNMSIPQVQYRTDISTTFYRVKEELETIGWLGTRPRSEPSSLPHTELVPDDTVLV